MASSRVEPLEPRQLLAASPAHRAIVEGPATAYPELVLSADQVRLILGRAASQALPTQAVVVVDREGDVLAAYAGTALVPNTPAYDDAIASATTRARTAAYFQSNRNAFTTRTARFIVQDHFPYPVHNTPGGPLYGVQFSNLPGTDVARNVPAISGDPGGVPLYFNRSPVGAIGVAGDGRDVAFRPDALPADGSAPSDNPNREFYAGREEKDFDEAVALAGAKGFMAPEFLRANHIFLDGLRLPFLKDKPAKGKPVQTLDALLASGAGALVGDLLAGSPSPYPNAEFSGMPGELKNPDAPNPFAAAGQITGSNDAAAVKLTESDVSQIIAQAVAQARITRSGLRKPNGVAARIHVAVVDRDGDVLGVFRMNDGTLFSYDVAVQKARTAAFFSDDTHAFSTRAVGFLSQRFFPPGINQGSFGPTFGLQAELSRPENLKGALSNGITIFPGGFPLYKDGLLVGGVGISGDGVDQDDLIAYAGAKSFQPDNAIRSDFLNRDQVRTRVLAELQTIQQAYRITYDLTATATERFNNGFSDFRLPYVKFPRNPLL